MAKEKKTCCVCGSDKLVQGYRNTGKNYCSKHRSQMNKYGYILTQSIRDRNEIIKYDDYAEIVLKNKNLEETGRALISLDKIEKVKNYKWYLMQTGYVATRTGGKHFLLHRLIMDAEEEILIDHINHNKLDCRNENLRKCDKSQNTMNSSLSKRNKSGVTGVWFDKRDKRWIAEIFVKGKKYSIGRSLDKNEAIKMRKEAEKEYFGEFAPKGVD